jgi:hypothetical protein
MNENTDEAEALENRREAKRRRLGDLDPACGCGETDPIKLTGRAPDIQCYECQAAEAGRSWLEDHHPAGKANHPVTVRIPGNEHRRIDDLKNDWSRETLRNPSGSPLLRAAACLRGWLNVMQVLIDSTLGWIPAFLEALDRWLVNVMGPSWWTKMLPPDPA